jgi:rubrerythrin
MSIDADLLRHVMARECETVNEYLAMAERAQSPEVKGLLLHLAYEEKEHIAVCAKELMKVDADHKMWMEKVHAPVDAEGKRLNTSASGDHGPGANSTQSVGAASSSVSDIPQFTIGSLIR